MKTLSLSEYFSEAEYDWEKDKESFETIYHYTKTRANPKLASQDFQFVWGMEQTFLIKAIAEHYRAQRFFEIGTGRGTACYALSQVPEIQKILTIDILKYKQKFATAIGFKPVTVSNADIFNMMPIATKDKIEFEHRSNLPHLVKMEGNTFDIAFIDGEHDHKKTIEEDFEFAELMIKDGGIILWDDYDPDKFSVKEVVDGLVDKHGYDAILVEHRGHLFSDKTPEYDRGVVIMKLKGQL